MLYCCWFVISVLVSTMSLETQAIYENGSLKLDHPLPLDEQQRVRVVVQAVEEKPLVFGDANRDKFAQLAQQWRAETQWLSSTTEMALHPAYQGIIGMGAEALPLILTELQAGYWYWALKAISGEDPVPPEDRGAVPRMKEAWLKWGLAKGLISA